MLTPPATVNAPEFVVPPTYKFPPIPTPPATVNAPEFVEFEIAVDNILIELVVEFPRLVIESNVSIPEIVTTPELVCTSIPLPELIWLTPCVAVVIT